MQTIYIYLITLIILPIIDLAWVGGIAKNYYKQHLGGLLATNTTWWAIAALYIVYVAGLVYFVVAPAIGQHNVLKALLGGLFFGLVVYGTYDLTNLALIANWPLGVSAVDILWGAFAGGLASTLAYLVASTVFGL
jgi:uncharacterized membrane protein